MAESKVSIRTLRGDILTVDYNVEGTVSDLKKRIAQQIDINPANQRLIFTGQEMMDSLPIKPFELHKHGALHLVIRANQKASKSLAENLMNSNVHFLWTINYMANKADPFPEEVLMIPSGTDDLDTAFQSWLHRYKERHEKQIVYLSLTAVSNTIWNKLQAIDVDKKFKPLDGSGIIRQYYLNECTEPFPIDTLLVISPLIDEKENIVSYHVEHHKDRSVRHTAAYQEKYLEALDFLESQKQKLMPTEAIADPQPAINQQTAIKKEPWFSKHAKKFLKNTGLAKQGPLPAIVRAQAVVPVPPPAMTPLQAFNIIDPQFALFTDAFIDSIEIEMDDPTILDSDIQTKRAKLIELKEDIVRIEEPDQQLIGQLDKDDKSIAKTLILLIKDGRNRLIDKAISSTRFIQHVVHVLEAKITQHDPAIKGLTNVFIDEIDIEAGTEKKDELLTLKDMLNTLSNDLAKCNPQALDNALKQWQEDCKGNNRLVRGTLLGYVSGRERLIAKSITNQALIEHLVLIIQLKIHHIQKNINALGAVKAAQNDNVADGKMEIDPPAPIINLNAVAPVSLKIACKYGTLSLELDCNPGMSVAAFRQFIFNAFQQKYNLDKSKLKNNQLIHAITARDQSNPLTVLVFTQDGRTDAIWNDDKATLDEVYSSLRGNPLVVTTRQILYSIPSALGIQFEQSDVVLSLNVIEIWEMTPHALWNHCIERAKKQGYECISGSADSSSFVFKSAESTRSIPARVKFEHVGKLWFSNEDCRSIVDAGSIATIKAVQLRKVLHPNPPAPTSVMGGYYQASWFRSIQQEHNEPQLTFDCGWFNKTVPIEADTTVGMLRNLLRQALQKRFSRVDYDDQNPLIEAIKDENQNNPLMRLVFTRDGNNELMDNDDLFVLDFYARLSSQPIKVKTRQLFYGIPDSLIFQFENLPDTFGFDVKQIWDSQAAELILILKERMSEKYVYQASLNPSVAFYPAGTKREFSLFHDHRMLVSTILSSKSTCAEIRSAGNTIIIKGFDFQKSNSWATHSLFNTASAMAPVLKKIDPKPDKLLVIACEGILIRYNHNQEPELLHPDRLGELKEIFKNFREMGFALALAPETNGEPHEKAVKLLNDYGIIVDYPLGSYSGQTALDHLRGYLARRTPENNPCWCRRSIIYVDSNPENLERVGKLIKSDNKKQISSEKVIEGLTCLQSYINLCLEMSLMLNL